MTATDEAGFAALAGRIAGQAGLDIWAYKDRCLRRRIAVRMRACGVHSYNDYVALLDENPGEFERLLDALTINVTKFFRNREAWDWLGERLLPELLLARQGQLRVWSAGCASGEEPYTIAMLLAGVLHRMDHDAWFSRVRIDATDIDRRSMDRARAARYPRRAFSEADPAIPERYCRVAGEGEEELEILPEIRGAVEIRSFDLTRDTPPAGRYDLVCCRNVVIYFDRATQERLMNLFADALAAEGILLLGKVETIMGAARNRYVLLEPRERIYRKIA